MWNHTWLGVGELHLEGDTAELVLAGPCLDCGYPVDWHYPDWALRSQEEDRGLDRASVLSFESIRCTKQSKPRSI